ncbi:hypothetical protein Q4603_20320 [Zobellia galactanivorans]|uniref:hypothetical protein n=1 Tax=Zobellia TaxID=112040 RepID=UPI000B53871A|nr:MULTISPECIES: hypothetical protein [Zobellia]MDO6810978.1 hypothetical protein [Zobellia galactanivorans]OWW24550.1 hypothetical protein B4Q04_14630 [Zobellia sp. OII3]
MNLLKKKYFSLLLFLLFAGVLVAITVWSKYDIAQHEKYTIGYVYDIDGGTATASPSLVYKYFVTGKEYHSTSSFSKNKELYLNHFYRVRYSFKNPGSGEILLNQPITDTIKIKKAGFSLPQKKRNQFQEL